MMPWMEPSFHAARRMDKKWDCKLQTNEVPALSRVHQEFKTRGLSKIMEESRNAPPCRHASLRGRGGGRHMTKPHAASRTNVSPPCLTAHLEPYKYLQSCVVTYHGAVPPEPKLAELTSSSTDRSTDQPPWRKPRASASASA